MSQSWRGCNSSDYCINVLYSASRSYLCGSKHKMASALRALKRPGAHSYPFMQSTQQQPLKEILGFWSMNFRQLGEWSPFFVATFYKCEVFGYGTVTNIHITLDSLSYWLLIWLNQRLEEKKKQLVEMCKTCLFVERNWPFFEWQTWKGRFKYRWIHFGMDDAPGFWFMFSGVPCLFPRVEKSHTVRSH